MLTGKRPQVVKDALGLGITVSHVDYDDDYSISLSFRDHTADHGGQPIYKLLLNRDSPGPDGPSIQSHQRLYDARQFFADYLSNERDQRGPGYTDYLVSLRNKVVQYLKVTVYTVEEQEEVGVIFETLNDRGKPLSELEKVKNYLLYLASKLDVPRHQLAEEVNRAWTRIFERLMQAHMASGDDEDRLLRSHCLMIYDSQQRNWKGSKSIKAQP